MVEVRRPRRRRRWLRRLLGVVVVFLVAVACGMNPSVPSDAVMNAIPIPPVDPRLSLGGEQRCLVVLQHGLWRSAYALWRLERALEAHGYEVLNVSYPSTRDTIENHATALAAALHARLAAAPAPRVCFVGHSMGGLVIRAYLARADAVQPSACVFVGTPQRGAQLAAQRVGNPFFALLMGDDAALQLVPGHPFYAGLRRIERAAVGVIAGGRGDGDGFSDAIAGDDDGTVAVAETHLPEERDHVVLPVGHTMLALDARMIGQVLAFLHHGRFQR